MHSMCIYEEYASHNADHTTLAGRSIFSAVVTNPFSDWSLASVELKPDQDNIYVEMIRKAGVISIRYAIIGENVPLGQDLATIPLRTVNGYTGDGANEKIEVGIMLCSPISEHGVQVNFKDICVQQM